MVVDGEGRAWVGNFGFDLMAGADPAPTVLIRVDPDGTVAVVAGDLWFPNGTVIAGDGGTLIVGETIGGEIAEEIPMPEGLGAFACMLGGDDGRTLLVCAAPDFAEDLRSAAREGVLLTTTVDVPHAGLP